ncbi:MAG: sigma-70 family RNA polymerase sigma factor [Myxococcales bacterium]|nr:sigma-70 family RNA polymerase sigma factor [Myxococcales bacterium]
MTERRAGGHLRSVPGSAARTTPSASGRSALETLYREHAGFVWRAVRRLGVPEAAAEDVVQEVFLVVRRRLPEYEGRGAPTSWLYAIARGVAANHRRGRARADRRLRVVPEPRPLPSPEDEVGRADAAARVRDFLATLDLDQREVFVLVDVEGLSGPEVAEALGINLNVAYSRLRLARRKLRRFVADRLEPEDPS